MLLLETVHSGSRGARVGGDTAAVTGVPEGGTRGPARAVGPEAAWGTVLGVQPFAARQVGPLSTWMLARRAGGVVPGLPQVSRVGRAGESCPHWA